MATITNGSAGTRRDFVTGNIRMVQVTSDVTDGDIWQPGLRVIEYVEAVPSGTASTITFAANLATAGQATIDVTNGPATAAVLRAWGY